MKPFCPNCQTQITLLNPKLNCKCGYSLVGGHWENEEGLPVCPICNELMHPIYDNVGFTAPDPEKIIITGLECKSCGITINE